LEFIQIDFRVASKYSKIVNKYTIILHAVHRASQFNVEKIENGFQGDSVSHTSVRSHFKYARNESCELGQFGAYCI